MSEPRQLVIPFDVPTRRLEYAVERLPLRKYPARLRAIEQELIRRKAEGRRAA